MGVDLGEDRVIHLTKVGQSYFQLLFGNLGPSPPSPNVDSGATTPLGSDCDGVIFVIVFGLVLVWFSFVLFYF